MSTDRTDFMGEWMDGACETWKAGMTAGTKLVEAWTKVATAAPVVPKTVEEFQVRRDRAMDEMAPFARRGVDAFVDGFTTQVRNNVDAVTRGWKPGRAGDDQGVSVRFEDACLDMMKATRENLNVAADTGVKMVRNWSALCEASCPCGAAPKSEPQKPSGKPKS